MPRWEAASIDEPASEENAFYTNGMMRYGLAGIAVVLAGAAVAGLWVYLLGHPEVWPPDDIIEYWAASRLVLAGDNPYAAESLLPLQQAGGRDTSEAVMMWNPPWTLTLVLPLGMLSARTAQLVWLMVHLVVLLYCGDRLWKLYGGAPDRRWLGWLITVAALPTLFALQAGQITPLMLLGVILWLQSQQTDKRHKRLWLAAVAAWLLAIKPHLVLLLGLVMAVAVVRQKQWDVLLAAVVVLLVAVGGVMLWRPEVIHDYHAALRYRPPVQWHSPTLGAYLRLWLGAEHFYWQFVPTLLALIGLVVAMGIGWPQQWHWRQLLPPLLILSLLAAPYGAWPFDLVLLLPAVFALLLHSARQWGRWGVIGFAVAIGFVNLGCLIMNLCRQPSSLFVWVTPTVGLLYGVAVLGARYQRRREPVTALHVALV